MSLVQTLAGGCIARLAVLSWDCCRKSPSDSFPLQDIESEVIRNELSEPELVFQVVKDAKSMTNTPEKRSVAVVRSRFYIADHGILDPNMNFMKGYRHDHGICYNSMLPILAMLVAGDRLRDYRTSKAFFLGNLRSPTGWIESSKLPAL